MQSQFRTLFPLFLVAIILLIFPFAESVWKRYNPLFGAWQGEQITFYNSSQYHTSLRESFRRWEEAGLPFRFVETRQKDEADLIVFSDPDGLRDRCRGCAGWATIGYSPLRQAEMWLLPPSHPYERTMQDFQMMPTIIHEIGHVLGLQHNSELCSVMNSNDRACRSLARSRITAQGRTMLCGPWKRDLEDLRVLYPSVGSSFSGWCHDPRANWDFFAQRGKSMIRALEKFQKLFIGMRGSSEIDASSLAR